MASHNPYFNRWFSAILIGVQRTMTMRCHNPYFNRWFSAIMITNGFGQKLKESHNPYFNRWFSAIDKKAFKRFLMRVTILILIDGFLQ